MIALPQMREQRTRQEGKVARALDLGEQIPARAARIEGIQDDIACGEVCLQRRTLGIGDDLPVSPHKGIRHRSEEHTSELQSLMRISYAVFCLKKKNIKHKQDI